jgi:hypothetical protein
MIPALDSSSAGKEVRQQGGGGHLSAGDDDDSDMDSIMTADDQPFDAKSDADDFVPVKRKRGRPPKSQPDPNNTTNSCHVSKTTNSDNNQIQPLMEQKVRRSTRVASATFKSRNTTSSNVTQQEGINSGASTSNEPNLLNNNTYGILSNNENEVITTRQATAKPKAVRLPEIKVLGVKFAELKSILGVLLISNLQVKLTQDGARIRLHSTQDFTAVVELLRKSNKDFYTHDLPEHRKIRFVLYGVPDLDIPYISEDLKMKGVEPTEIRKMKLKKTRYDDEANYILYFTPGTTNINELKKIKDVCHAVCRWSQYKNDNKGPIQCHRCQRLGHGQRNCNLPYRCVICSDLHESTACPFKSRGKQYKVNQELLKCANCDGNHTSSFLGCEKKLEFSRLQKLKKSAVQNQKMSSQPNAEQKQTKTTPFVFNAGPSNSKKQDKLPSFSFRFNNQKKDINSNLNNTQTINTNENLLSSFFTNQNINCITNGRTQCSTENFEPNPKAKNETLFSFAEIIALTNEIISKLRNCRTRDDQFQVIVHLTLKYIYNLP